MLESIAKNNFGVLCSFVGTGKSRVKYEVVRQTPGHRLLVFPSINLIEQFANIYVPHAFAISAERPKSATEIREHFDTEDGVTLITYQSLQKVAPFFPKLAIVLYDEAHHICTARHISMLERLAELGVRRYFFTATPKDSKNLRMLVSPEQLNEEHKLAPSVDRCKRLVGGLIYQYNFAIAVSEKVVSDYALCFVTYQMTSESRELTQFHHLMKLAKRHARKRILVYNRYLASGRNEKTTVQGFAAAGANVKCVAGGMNLFARAEIFAWFQAPGDDVRVLCNVGTIKEGVDLPCIDMIAFCDDKQSRIEIIQCLGRGLRIFPDKRDCIVCCCIPINENVVEAEAEFQTIRHVLTALKSIDSRIEDVLSGKQSALKLYYQKHKGNAIPKDKFIKMMNIGVKNNMSFAKLAEKHPEHFADLKIKIDAPIKIQDPPKPVETNAPVKTQDPPKVTEADGQAIGAKPVEANGQAIGAKPVEANGQAIGAELTNQEWKQGQVDDKKRKCFIENINAVANEYGAYGQIADSCLSKWFGFVCKQRESHNLPQDQLLMVEDLLAAFGEK